MKLSTKFEDLRNVSTSVLEGASSVKNRLISRLATLKTGRPWVIVKSQGSVGNLGAQGTRAS